MVSGASGEFPSLSAPYTLVYQRNHGLLPHSSNTLLHGTNSNEVIISDWQCGGIPPMALECRAGARRGSSKIGHVRNSWQ